MRKGRADKVVYPGAGASLLGENSGIRTREEADALVARFIGTGHAQKPQEASEPKVRVIDPPPAVEVPEPVLTREQNLIMEVLAARDRLGEYFWTFSTDHRSASKKLEDLGYVILIHGIVEKTIRVTLTAKGKERFQSKTYHAPIEGWA